MAATTMAWALVAQFDVSMEVVLDMLIMCVVLVGTVMVCAAALLACWKLIGWALRSRAESETED